MARKAARKTMPSIISKDVIAREIARVLADRGLTQTEASYIVGAAPSQLSLITTGKLTGFSAERLLRTLVRLGRDVEIRFSQAKGKAGKVSLRVQ